MSTLFGKRAASSSAWDRRVAEAVIDAACLSMHADRRVDPAEVEYARGVAAELLPLEDGAADLLVSDSLARIAAQGPGPTRASIAERLRSPSQREVAYLVASGVMYGDRHLAHREAQSLRDLAAALELSPEVVDRLSTDEPLVLAARYPRHWRLEPACPPGSVDRGLRAWAEARGFLRDPRARAALDALDLETFQRLTFPQCGDPDAILWAARYTLWLYLFDDVVEGFMASGQIERAHDLVEPCLTIPSRRSAPAGTHPLIAAFAELTAELYARTDDPEFPAKWEDSHRRYWLCGILNEAATADTTGAAAGGLRHHLQTRPWASGVGIYFDIGEVICGAPLPMELRLRTDVHTVRHLVALLGGVFNDLLSFDKEKPFENLTNTALAFRRELELDDRGALTYAIALHDQALLECDARFMRLGHDQTLARYGAMCRHVVYGLAAWQLQSQPHRNRHTVVLSTDGQANPRIDEAQLTALRDLALEEEPGRTHRDG
jgi:hypothetical protein